MERCWLLPFFLLTSSLLLATSDSSLCPASCDCRDPPRIKCIAYVPEIDWLYGLPAKSGDYRELWLDNVMLPVLESRSRELDCHRANFYCLKLEAITVTRYTWPADQTDALAVTAKFLSSLPRLKYLNVSHNDFQSIDWCRDVSAPNVVTFNASHNKIYTLARDAFQGMSQLDELVLANNQLYELTPAFERLQKLRLLDLSNNRILRLNGALSKMLELRRLNLAGNRISFLLDDYFQDLRSLVELDISRNAFQFIRAESLQSLASLSVLNLSENRLIERDLSLLLDSVRRLEVVDASRIGLWRVPATLTRSVKIMRLVGNQLTAINSGDLDSYPLLQLLDLSGNKLIAIEDDALGRLDDLMELNLYGNILSSVPKSLPSNLKTLDLRQNTIATVNVNDLRGLSELAKLDLSGNVLSSIENGAFRHLTALRELDISDNPIKRLTSDALSGPLALTRLRMSGLTEFKLDENQNQDTAFPYSTPEYMLELDLSRSSSLAALFLADNATLSACKELTRLDLSNTNISAIRSDLHYVLPELKEIDLLGNEFNCSKWTDALVNCHKYKSIEFLPKGRPESKPQNATTLELETTTARLPSTLRKTNGSSSKSQMNKEFDMLIKPTATPPTTIIASFKYAAMTEWPTTKITSTTAQTTKTQTKMQTLEDDGTTPSTVTVSDQSSTYFVEKRLDLYTPREAITSKPKVVNNKKMPKKATAVEDNQTTMTTTTTTTATATTPIPTSSYKKKVTTTITARAMTTSNEDVINGYSEVQQPAVINLENDDITTTVYDEKLLSNNHMFSEFSRSKVLLANDEEQVSAEELINERSQRNTEFFSSGAHPGMLILVGAVIGAAAALTVVLSRRATAKGREPYHRQENIALTPTTERW